MRKALREHPIYKSKERNRRLSESHKGIKLSEEHKRKISLGNKGKKLSIKHIENLKKAFNSGRFKKGDNFKHGLGYLPYSLEFRKKREFIRERDNYTCVECEISQKELRKTLDVHHIDGNKFNNMLNNLITLCRECHIKVGRE